MHQGIEQVGMFSYMDGIQMSRQYRRDHDLFGIEPEDLSRKKIVSGKLKKELIKFNYPNRDYLKKIGVKGIYLNNYLNWDNRKMQENIILMEFRIILDLMFMILDLEHWKKTW